MISVPVPADHWKRQKFLLDSLSGVPMSLFRFSWHSCGKFNCTHIRLYAYTTFERGSIFFINNIYIINIFIPSESEIGKNEQMNKWTFTHPHRHIVNFFPLPQRACRSYPPSARGACRPSPARWGAPTWCVWGVERYIFCLKPQNMILCGAEFKLNVRKYHTL